MPQPRFPEPRQCVLWNRPELVRDGTMKERFELVREYASESHLRRYLLKCRECGQLYFFEFYEEIDWDKGNDPQYTKYIPVPTADEGSALSRYALHALLDVWPALCIDFPRDAESPTVYWARKPGSGWLTRFWRR
jgi:hypothetical protein